MKNKNLPTLQIIGPVYNEEEVIDRFFLSLDKVLYKLKRNYNCQVMFVVDKSSDKTVEKLKKIASKMLTLKPQ